MNLLAVILLLVNSLDVRGMNTSKYKKNFNVLFSSIYLLFTCFISTLQFIFLYIVCNFTQSTELCLFLYYIVKRFNASA